MKKRVWSIIAILALVSFTTPAQAQEAEEEEARDNLELHLFGGFGVPAGGLSSFGDSLGAKAGPAAGIEFGYIVSDRWSFGLNFTYYQFGVEQSDFVGDLKHQIYSPRLYARHVFPTESNLELFAKGYAGVDNAKFATLVATSGSDRVRELSYDPAISLGLSAGVTLYTADYSGLFLEIGYHHALSDKSEKQFAGETYIFGENTGVLDIHAGFRLLFGSE